MRQIVKTDDLRDYIKWCQSSHKTIGFVPTMGALHEGHIMLVEQAVAENDIVIVSVFVNPTQFNNPKDLANYPRTLEADAALLQSVHCDVLFAPDVHDIYSTDFIPRSVDLGLLDRTLEGEYRPGHFHGVINVVERLFQLTEPTRAYFGRKDFQQVAVIKTMVKQLAFPIDIVTVDTVRNEQGLALSSRNTLLSAEEKNEALHLSRVLFLMKDWAQESSPEECVAKGKEELEKTTLRLEYLEIVHPLSFEKLTTEWTSGATVCVVAYCGSVRLIDNMELISN